jgi:hypothetical protein
VISFAARKGSMAEVRQAIGKPGKSRKPRLQVAVVMARNFGLSWQEFHYSETDRAFQRL